MADPVRPQPDHGTFPRPRRDAPRPRGATRWVVGVSLLLGGAIVARDRAGPSSAFRAARLAAHADDDGGRASAAGTYGDWDPADGKTSRKEGRDHGTCRLYKRTIATPNAFEDGLWMRDNLGLSMTLNKSYDGGASGGAGDDDDDPSGSECAHRVWLEALDAWVIHLFESHVTREGNVSVASFAHDWALLHGGFGTSSYAWDAWTMQSQTFYAPALTPFLKRWAENGVKFVGSRYATEFDNVTMYSAMVSMPHAGHVVEIVSDKVGSAYAADFAPLDDRACPDAVKVSASARELEDMWREMGGSESDDDAGKLPSLLIAKVSQPSESPGELYRYLAEFGSDEVAHNYTRVDFGPAESFCEFDRVRLRKCTYADDDACSDDHYNWHIDVQSVNNPSAVQGRYSVGFYEHAVQGYHSAMLGCNSGWDRHLDNRAFPRARAPLFATPRARALSPDTGARARARADLGVWCEQPAKLDRIAPKMCAAGVGFHAHSGSGAIGSIWSAGVGGVAIEFRGKYTYEFFNKSALGLLNYCTTDSNGKCDPNRC